MGWRDGGNNAVDETWDMGRKEKELFFLRLCSGKTERDVHAAALDLGGLLPQRFFDGLGHTASNRMPFEKEKNEQKNFQNTKKTILMQYNTGAKRRAT